MQIKSWILDGMGEREEERSIKKLNLWNIISGILSMPNLTLPSF